MTREQVIQRARKAIPDFLRAYKGRPARVPPVNGDGAAHGTKEK